MAGRTYRWGKAAAAFLTRLEWIVPILALVATLWVGWNTSYANKIQTLPNLHVRSGPDANGKPYCGIGEQGIEPSTRTICLENNGLGPARLVGFDVVIKGHYIETNHALNWRAIDAALDEAGIEPPSVMATQLPSRNIAIKPGEAVQLTRFKPLAVVSRRTDLQQAIDGKAVDIGVCYCNYYSDCFYESLHGGPGRFDAEEQSCQNGPDYKRWNWWAPVSRSLVE